MAKAVKFKPDGYHAVTPYLTVIGAGEVVEFAKKVFDGVVAECTMRPDGTVGHAEIKIDDSVVMVGESGGEFKPMPAMLYVYVEDVDATYKRALDAGATPVMEPKDQFYGDRSGGVTDAAGNQWWFATHVEDISPEEMERRASAHMKK